MNRGTVLAGMLIGLVTNGAIADPLNYDESVDGDLDYFDHRVLALDEGINRVSGTFGQPDGAFDSDAFRFSVPGGTVLSALTIRLVDALGDITDADWYFGRLAPSELWITTVSSASPGSDSFSLALDSGVYLVSGFRSGARGDPPYTSAYVWEMVVIPAAANPPPALISLKPLKTLVSGCKPTTFIATLSRPAPADGVTIIVDDDLASTVTPMTVRIPAGAVSKRFSLKTEPVSEPDIGPVYASLGATRLHQEVWVSPIQVQRITLSPTKVVGSKPVEGAVTLECPAAPGPVTVALQSSNPSVAGPVADTVVVPQGLRTASFDVLTNPVLAITSTKISAENTPYPFVTKTKTLGLVPAAAVSPTRLSFGSVSVGQTSGALSTILRNNGVVPFAVNGISLTGTYASWFAQTNNCPANLAAGASCTISVRFAPQAALSRSAKLSIATGATSTPLSVSLSGTGI